MDEDKIKRNIKFLTSIKLPLSEKLDKVIRPGLITTSRVAYHYIPDADIKIPINRPKLWISRVKKNSKNQSKTPRADGKFQEIIGNTIKHDGQSLLQQASYYGKITVIKKLIEEGADINKEDWYGSTAILHSIKANQISSVKELLKFPQLNIIQKYGDRHETALLKAVKLGHSEIVSLICKARKEVVAKQDVDGRTPLFYSIIKGHSEMVIDLITAGSREKDLIDYKGNNAVYLAIDQGEVASVETLLNCSDFELNESLCERVLLMGCYSNQIGLVKSALPRIPKNYSIREEGLSPILISFLLGFVNITYELLRNSSVEEIDFVSVHGKNLLIEACKKNDEKMVETILIRNCNPNLVDLKGRTGLHEACEKGFEDVCYALLSRTTRINLKDALGNTPMMLACKNKMNKIVELLVKRGADVNECDYLGKSPRNYANKEITEILDSFPGVFRLKRTRRLIKV